MLLKNTLSPNMEQKINKTRTHFSGKEITRKSQTKFQAVENILDSLSCMIKK